MTTKIRKRSPALMWLLVVETKDGLGLNPSDAQPDHRRPREPSEDLGLRTGTALSRSLLSLQLAPVCHISHNLQKLLTS